MQRKYIGFFLGITAFLSIFLLTDLEPGKPEVSATLAVAALMAIWWITRSGISINSFTIPGWAAIFKVPAYINDGTVEYSTAIWG